MPKCVEAEPAHLHLQSSRGPPPPCGRVPPFPSHSHVSTVRLPERSSAEHSRWLPNCYAKGYMHGLKGLYGPAAHVLMVAQMSPERLHVLVEA
jgi:hypothetical protein